MDGPGEEAPEKSSRCGWSGNNMHCCSCCLRYSPVVRPFEAGQVWWACDIEQVLGLLNAQEDELCEVKGDNS